MTKSKTARTSPIGTMTIALSSAQVASVVRQAKRAAGAEGVDPSVVLALFQSRVSPELMENIALEDRRLSQSFIRGIVVLGAFDGNTPQGVLDIAAKLKLSPSTTHRYLTTLVALGLLEHTSDRTYCLPAEAVAEQLRRNGQTSKSGRREKRATSPKRPLSPPQAVAA